MVVNWLALYLGDVVAGRYSDLTRSGIVFPFIVTAFCYFLAGIIGQLLAIPPGYATLVWPASGIALGTAMIWGRPAICGVLLGSFLVNLFITSTQPGQGLSVTIPFLIGLGAAFQAMVGAALARRFIGFPFNFNNVATVTRFILLCGAAASLTNASLSCTLLLLTGTLDNSQFLVNWLSWWAGDALGVIIVLPWLLVSFPAMGKSLLPKRIRLFESLVVVTGVTLVLVLATARFEHEKQSETFHNNASFLANSLQERINSSVDILYGLSGFVLANQSLTPQQFSDYASPILEREPGLQGLSWNIAVAGRELATFNSRFREIYNDNSFTVKQRNSSGELVPASPLPRHVIVSYIAPLQENQAALGYDVYSQEDRRKALDSAYVQRQEALTDPISLVQESGSQAGVLIFLPVFDQSDINRSSDLLGYATAVLRIGDLAEIAFAQGLLPHTALILIDPQTSVEKQLLYRTGRFQQDPVELWQQLTISPAPMQLETLITVGENQWSLLQFSELSYLYQPWGAYLVMTCGLLMSGLISWFLIIVAGHTQEIERQVESRTQQLRVTNNILEASQHVAGMGSWEIRSQPEEHFWSNEFYRLLGYNMALPASVNAFLAMVHQDDYKTVRDRLREWQEGGIEDDYLQCRISADNSSIEWLELYCKRLDHSYNLSIVARDISQNHQQQEQMKLAAITFESQNALVITDAEFKIQRINQEFSVISGYSENKLIGKSLQILKPQQHPDSFYSRNIETGKCEVWTGKSEDEDFLARIVVSEVTGPTGQAEHYVLSFIDITARKASEARIHNLAYFDSLTNLPNRSQFYQQLSYCIRHAKRQGSQFAVLFLDLDGFKDVNDSMGHDVGDQLICNIATRIQFGLRESDFAARLGGDEFCVLATDLPDAQAAAVIAQKLLAVINEPMDLSGTQYQPNCSIGIALYPDHGIAAKGLIKAADTAMYLAKDSGKNQYSFYHRELTERSVEQLHFENDLRAAIYSGELELYFQPQYSLQSRKLTGVEALIRWPHESRGLLYPDQFLPLAKRLKLAEGLDLWVLNTAIKQAADWLSSSPDPFRISVNINSETFSSRAFVDAVDGLLKKYQLPAAALELEVADTFSLRSKTGRDNVRQLQEMGVSMAIDRFGSSGSALIDLIEIGFDTIKIDRPFIAAITERTDAAVLLGSIIGSAHGMGATVIAQGVETLEQVQVLHGLGCDIVQGLYFYQPLDRAGMQMNEIFNLPEMTNQVAINE